MRKVPTWLWLLGLGAGGYLLMRAKAAAATPALPGGSSSSSGGALAPSSATGLTVPVLPGSSAPTASALYTGNSFWGSLTPTSPPNSGYINFPSGAQVPAAELTAGNTAMDSSGNVYVLWGGQVYALGFPDANGNWPVTLVQGAQ